MIQLEDVNQPAIAASQGHSVKTDGSDFCSGEAGGVIKMYGNIMAECGGSNEYMDGDLNIVTNHYKCTDRFTGARELTDAMKTANSKGFYPSAPDAFMANSRDEKVPAAFYALSGGQHTGTSIQTQASAILTRRLECWRLRL